MSGGAIPTWGDIPPTMGHYAFVHCPIHPSLLADWANSRFKAGWRVVSIYWVGGMALLERIEP